jgi:hypothetical protein
MDAGMTAAAGLGASILVASATLVLLARAPSGPSRSPAAALMAVILSAAALMMAFPEVPGSSVFLMVGVLLGFVFSNAARKKSLFIAPESETPVLDEPLRLLSPGATYLFLREKEEARELLVLYLKSGRPGLWVTRRPPREAREMYKLDRTPFIWLTSSAVPGENCLDPGDFGPLGTAITSFTRDAKDYLILIEGVEYIMTKTGFNTVLKLVQFLNDRVMSTGGILMLGLNPNAVKGNELALLKSEAAGVFEVAGPAANPGRVSRS